jgi:uncharacterized protein (TIRG00374 family)
VNPRTRQIAITVGKILVSVGLLAWLGSRIDFVETTRLILDADPAGLLGAGLTFLASNLLGAIQWRVLLRANGLDIPFAHVIAYYFQGLFFGLFLPASVGADVSRVYDTTRHTGELGPSVAATVMDRLVGFYSMGMMAVLALLLGLPARPPAVILVPILGFALVNLVVATALFSRRVSGLLGSVARRLPQEGLRRLAVGLVETLHGLGRQPGLLAWVLSLSIVVQVLRVLMHYQVAMAMSIDLPLRDFFVIIPVLAVLVALPISFGGIGVREWAAVELFGHVNVPEAQAVGMQVAAFLISIIVNLPGWFIFVGRQLGPRRQESTTVPPDGAGRG